MKRAVLKFTRPQDIMCEACSDIENFYNSQSRTVQEMKERRRAAADTLSMLFGQEAYETQIYQPWVTFFTVWLYYWFSRGIQSVIRKDNADSLQSIDFTIGGHPELGQLQAYADRRTTAAGKRQKTAIPALDEYRSMFLREIEGIAPYAFVCGYEWGYELLYSSGVIHDKLDWKALYQLLPLL